MRRIGSFIAILCGLSATACSPQQPKQVDYYHVAFRQNGPEPVYSRFMWSHLPRPFKPKVPETAPYYLPVVRFDMPDATLEQAVEALAQAMGYRWQYPNGVAKRKVDIRMEGTVEAVLEEISTQAKVHGLFDHQERMVRIVETRMVPQLPST
jgi:hypothetical protein